jgi:DNA-binding MarR family transcriptional regulator
MADHDTLYAIADMFLTVYPRFRRLLLSVQLDRDLEDEITVSQIRTLGKLIDQPITLSELAERCNLTRQGASLQVQYLVEHGWVRRLPDPADRRSALLEVTDEGRSHWQETRHSLVDRIAVMFEQLSPEELAALQTAFLALKRILDQSDSKKEV